MFVVDVVDDVVVVAVVLKQGRNRERDRHVLSMWRRVRGLFARPYGVVLVSFEVALLMLMWWYVVDFPAVRAVFDVVVLVLLLDVLLLEFVCLLDVVVVVDILVDVVVAEYQIVVVVLHALEVSSATDYGEYQRVGS